MAEMWSPDDIEWDMVSLGDKFETDTTIGPLNHVKESIMEKHKMANHDHLQSFNAIQTQMGKLLTTDDIIELNKNRETAPIETEAMLSNVGIFSAQNDLADDSSCFQKQIPINLQSVIYEKKYPILLDHRFFKLSDGEKLSTDSEETSPSTATTSLNESSELNQSSSSVGSDSSSAVSIPYVAFQNTYKTTRYHHRPTVGVGRDTFVKPMEIYLTKRRSKQHKDGVKSDRLW